MTKHSMYESMGDILIQTTHSCPFHLDLPCKWHKAQATGTVQLLALPRTSCMILGSFLDSEVPPIPTFTSGVCTHVWGA